MLTNVNEITDKDIARGMVDNLGLCRDHAAMVRIANRKNERLYNAAKRLELALREAHAAAVAVAALYR